MPGATSRLHLCDVASAYTGRAIRLDGGTCIVTAMPACTLTTGTWKDDCIISACLYYLGGMIALLQHAGNPATAKLAL
jgi:hypothetical protein